MAAPNDNIPISGPNKPENGVTSESTVGGVPGSAPFLSAALPPIGSINDSGDSACAGPAIQQCISVELEAEPEDEPMDADDMERSSSNLGEMRFDTCIGHIEDIIMEDEFHEIQQVFLDQYYAEFDSSDENKFCYTDIHNQYVQTIEKYLGSELGRRMPGFSMEEFAQQLQQKKEDDELLEGEIFEILLTFTDFLAFKEMILDYKAEKEGNAVDLSGMLTVTKTS